MAALPTVDAAVLREFEAQLTGEQPDFEAVTALREQAEERLKLRLACRQASPG